MQSNLTFDSFSIGFLYDVVIEVLKPLVIIIKDRTMIEWFRIYWVTVRNRTKQWYTRFCKDADQQYNCMLPGNSGSLSSFFLRLFFSGIRVNEHQVAILKNIPKDARVVYVTKHKNHFEHLFYHTRYQQEGLPFPELALDYRMLMWQPVSRMMKILVFHLDYFIHHFSLPDPYENGYLQNSISSGKSALFSLIDDRGFYRRFIKAKKDPTQCLIKAQRSSDRPIFIVPQLFFFGKKPEGAHLTLVDFLFGSASKPGHIRRLMTLFNRPDKINVEISEPLNLQQFLDQQDRQGMDAEQQSLHLRRQLLDQINRHRQGITGPYLKSKQELRESMLTSDALQTFMKSYAESRKLPVQKVHKRASDHLSKIAARYNPAVIKVLAAIVRWITNSMFDGTSMNHDGLIRIKVVSHKGPIIFVPCHKSHIDYLILSYIMYINNMPCPHVAAGDNLSFWPLGALFRRAGAFFIRRTFKGAELYSKVFNAYIHKLLGEGFNIEFFIEGGRSRTGKLILPKLGLLATLLRSYRNGACDDMIFVPVYVGYDRVLEERSYLDELEGGKKDPETLSQMIKASRFLRRRFGKIYINFHEPISLRELLDRSGTPMQQMVGEEFDSFCRNLGFRIINAIDRVSVITPHGLVAGAILNCAKVRFSFDQLMSHIDIYMRHLDAQNAKLADTLSQDRVHAIKQTLENYIQNRCVEDTSDESEGVSSETHYIVNENRRPILEYYKNNCVIFFIPAAYTSLAILEKDTLEFSVSEVASGYSFFQTLFKNDFAFDIDRNPEALVRQNLSAFLDEAMITPHPTLPDIYNITAEGLRKLKYFSTFLKAYLESYWITLRFLNQNAEETTDPEDQIRRIIQMGNQMYRTKEIVRRESLSRVTYKNAIKFFTGRVIRESDDADALDLYTREIQKYMNVL